MVNIMVQWLIAGFLTSIHPFFISVVDINHNAKNNSMEISIRVFTDDLEKTLQKQGKAKIDLINPADRSFVENKLANYIYSNLKLTLDGQPVNMRFLGYEQQRESIWSYFEVEKIPTVKKIMVHCSLLHDYETNQVNIIHAKSNGSEKSYKLDYPNTNALFVF